jgi:hypothetical protein
VPASILIHKKAARLLMGSLLRVEAILSNILSSFKGHTDALNIIKIISGYKKEISREMEV